MKLQTLVATMHRGEYSFLDGMNLEGEVVVVNQCYERAVQSVISEKYSAEVILTTKRGLSNSRNEAILNSNADIILTADDDIKYYHDYRSIILKQFENHPEADIIAFNIKRVNRPVNMSSYREITKWRKAPQNRFYPSVSLAYRKSSIESKNLHFHPLFGAGSKYSNGEESLFLRDARKAGLRVYECPIFICEVDFSTSTWFSGYDEKFFHDKGALLRVAYPHCHNIMKWYFIKLKISNNTQMSVKEIIHAMNKGIQSI